MSYKISVIVPVYNAEQYLNQCIDSILNQTLDSFELILLNDGSKDGSGAICDEYAEKYDNVSVYHLENGGPARARNIGISKAKGEYIGFVDSDDYIDEKMYEVLFSESQERNADIVMCTYSIKSENETVLCNMNYEAYYDSDSMKELILRYSSTDHNGLFSVCNKIFRRQLIVDNRLVFDEQLIRAEDAWFVFDCLKCAKKVSFINEPFYYYRQVETSTMHTIQNDRFERSKAFRNKLQSENDSLNLTYDKNEFFYEFLYECFTYCRAMYQKKNVDAVNAVINDDFFKNACNYSACMPIHLRLLCLLEKMNVKNLLKLLLKLWAK